jgi:hypothetical protein
MDRRCRRDAEARVRDGHVGEEETLDRECGVGLRNENPLQNVSDWTGLI